MYCVEPGTPNRESAPHEPLRSSLHRYETINSDIFSDPSTCSFDGLPQTPRKTVEFRLTDRVTDQDGVTESTNLRSEFLKDDYSDQQGCYTQTVNETDASTAGVGSGASRSSQNGGGSRRVSFQLESPMRSSSTVEFKVRR
ncbi:hypothetical protein Btru_014076 [Bulinus truncatus]|nr:hypothetical protein Btru_014076 [Bulinus truncatus]